jgi:4-hydroxy-tetrahydrodipicolinate synthase
MEILVQSPNSSLRQQLTGVLPPITMPFDETGELVKGGLREQIDFIIEKGANGVVAGGSTGEGHTLTDAEFATVMREAHEATAGRVPFLAGLIVQSTRAAIERANMLKGMQVAALQVTPVHYLFKPDADATVEHFRTISEATGLPILIYNVIPWNYLSVDLMLRIMDEVPGVVGMKQSGGDLKSLSDLLLRCKPENVVLSGVDALLYPGFCMGMHGAISALTSAVPHIVVRIHKAVEANDHKTARDLHFKLNALWNSMSHDNLPACIKYIQHLQGTRMFEPRAPMMRVTEQQKVAIKAAMQPLMA